MSKVVHLSDDAHQKAKEFCQARGLKMSEWVAALIERAAQDQLTSDGNQGPQHAAPAGIISHAHGSVTRGVSLHSSGHESDPVSAPYEALVQKKKLTPTASPVKTMPDSAAQAYEAPPFWAR